MQRRYVYDICAVVLLFFKLEDLVSVVSSGTITLTLKEHVAFSQYYALKRVMFLSL